MYVTVDVDVETVLADVSDQDIKEEYEARFGGDSLEELDTLQTAYMLHVQGRAQQAQALLHNYMLDKLGRVI